jgi:phosphonate transport system ATP-binding protein
MTAAGAIRVQNASIRLGRDMVLRDVSLEVASGERMVIVGPNGAGKSTLLKALGGLVAPSLGTVSWPAHPEGPRVAFIWQGIHLVQRLSVLENVLAGALGRCRSPLTWARIFPPDEVARAMAQLERLGIAHLARERAGRLSGGERQRVAIARALMQDADVLLADEPTASLDWSAAREVARQLSQLAISQGLTLVSAVHDLSLIPEFADRVVALRDGRVAFDGPWEPSRRQDMELLLAQAPQRADDHAPTSSGGCAQAALASAVHA